MNSDDSCWRCANIDKDLAAYRKTIGELKRQISMLEHDNNRLREYISKYAPSTFSGNFTITVSNGKLTLEPIKEEED